MLMEMGINPKYDVIDPNFRRLSYIRYADDFVVLTHLRHQKRGRENKSGDPSRASLNKRAV